MTTRSGNFGVLRRIYANVTYKETQMFLILDVNLLITRMHYFDIHCVVVGMTFACNLNYLTLKLAPCTQKTGHFGNPYLEGMHTWHSIWHEIHSNRANFV